MGRNANSVWYMQVSGRGKHSDVRKYFLGKGKIAKWEKQFLDTVQMLPLD